jgi:hypothetical protein
MICSVAVDHRISNVVDVPNYIVSGLLPGISARDEGISSKYREEAARLRRECSGRGI